MEQEGHTDVGCCRDKQGHDEEDSSIVKELLNFSNEEMEDTMVAADDDGGSEARRENSTADSTIVSTGDSSAISLPGDFNNLFSRELGFPYLADAGFSGDLHEPYEDLAELEWLSNFVEECFYSDELQKQHPFLGFKSNSSQPSQNSNYHLAATPAHRPRLFDPEVPVKTRSQRPRSAPSGWAPHLLLFAATKKSFSSENFDERVKRRGKKKNSFAAADGRKCLHCGTDKTPQWRFGPMGPKSLCNACGVRYKSGRLMPEYRPAASPTFVLCKHSNSHRKVLELRQQNEVQRRELQLLHVNGEGMDAPPPASGVDGMKIQRCFQADLRQVF